MYLLAIIALAAGVTIFGNTPIISPDVSFPSP